MFQINTKCAKWSQTISQMAEKYAKCPFNISTFSDMMPSKIYPNCDFGLKINHLAPLILGNAYSIF
jgi:hypothetical protein